MNTPRFVTKIVGGKLVTVPEYRDLSSSWHSGYSLKSTYPWGTFEPVASHKIGSRTYPILPPISDGNVLLCYCLNYCGIIFLAV